MITLNGLAWLKMYNALFDRDVFAYKSAKMLHDYVWECVRRSIECIARM